LFKLPITHQTEYCSLWKLKSTINTKISLLRSVKEWDCIDTTADIVWYLFFQITSEFSSYLIYIRPGNDHSNINNNLPFCLNLLLFQKPWWQYTICQALSFLLKKYIYNYGTCTETIFNKFTTLISNYIHSLIHGQSYFIKSPTQAIYTAYTPTFTTFSTIFTILWYRIVLKYFLFVVFYCKNSHGLPLPGIEQ